MYPIDTVTTLLQFIKEFKSDKILFPLHQRDYVWTPEKEKAFIDRLWNPIKPLGVITTYQISDEDNLNENEDGPVYINDFGQRLRATIKLYDYPEKYGHTIEEVEFKLNTIKFPQQHRWYRTHQDAFEDFQKLNIGTMLTPLEMCMGIIVYHKAYKQYWQPLFDRVNKTILQSGGGLVTVNTNREIEHKMIRHDYSLITRFLNSNPYEDYGEVGNNKIDIKDIANSRVVEVKLKKWCESYDIDEIKKRVNSFVTHINDHSVIIREIWKKLHPMDASAINHIMYRWLIETSIIVKKLEIPLDKWEKFVEVVLKRSGGTTTINHPDPSKTKKIKLGQGYRWFREICSKHDDLTDLITYFPKRRSRTKRQNFPGMEDSHIRPVSVNGDGPYFSEPKLKNRKRGAKPVDSETLNEYGVNEKGERIISDFSE